MRILCRVLGHRLRPVFIEPTPRIVYCSRCGHTEGPTTPLPDGEEIRRVAESLGYRGHGYERMSPEDSRMHLIWAEAYRRVTGGAA